MKFLRMLIIIPMLCSSVAAFAQSSSVGEISIGETKQAVLDAISAHPGTNYSTDCVNHFNVAHVSGRPMDFLAYTGYDLDGQIGSLWLYLTGGTVSFTVWSLDYDSVAADVKYNNLCRDYQVKYGNPVREETLITPSDCIVRCYKSGTEGICVSLLNHDRISIGMFSFPPSDSKKLSEAVF